MSTKLTTSEGGEVEVYGDLDENDNPIAILHLKCSLQFLDGESVEIPGASFEPSHGTEVRTRGNVALTRAQAEVLAEALLYETRPVDPGERRFSALRRPWASG